MEEKEKNALPALLMEVQSRKTAKRYGELLREGEEMRSLVPDFDIEKEVQDKRFAALLRSGFSVREAFIAKNAAALIAAAEMRGRLQAAKEFREETENSRESECDGRLSGETGGVASLTPTGIKKILDRVKNGARVSF